MRVYSIEPTGAGERPLRGVRILTRRGEVPFVRRVELDADADEGPATVTALVHDGTAFVVDPDARAPAVQVQFRAHVRIAPGPVEPTLTHTTAN